VDRTDPTPHVCDADRLVDFQMFGMRHEVARFDELLHHFLGSPTGRFEVWLAARELRRTA